MTLNRCAHSAIVFIIALIIVHAQWVHEDDLCILPSGFYGECKLVQKCKPIIDVLTNHPKPFPPEVRDILLNYRCKADEKIVKVCCPYAPIVIAGVVYQTPHSDFDKHKNAKLLPKSCGELQADDKILNGNVTALFEFPWMARISYRTSKGLQFLCGGTLINDRYVLTAAHCITNLGRRQLAGVRLGEHDVNKAIDCESHPDGETICADPVQDMEMVAAIPHPEYNTSTHLNDIGLIRLKIKANISIDSVRPICLPIDQSVRNTVLKKVVVTGWGRTLYTSESSVLLKVEIPVFNHTDCKKIYSMVGDKQICAGGRNVKDSCAGDSGGPMQVLGNLYNDVRYVQYGVVSFGPVPCGTIGRPGVYTKVVPYLEWILDTIKEY